MNPSDANNSQHLCDCSMHGEKEQIRPPEIDRSFLVTKYRVKIKSNEREY